MQKPSQDRGPGTASQTVPFLLEKNRKQPFGQQNHLSTLPLPVCTCGPAENSSSHWPSGSWGRVHRHSCSCVILTATTSTQVKIPTELSRLCDCNVRLHYSGPQVILVSCFLFVLRVTYTKLMTAACFVFFFLVVWHEVSGPFTSTFTTVVLLASWQFPYFAAEFCYTP